VAGNNLTPVFYPATRIKPGPQNGQFLYTDSDHLNQHLLIMAIFPGNGLVTTNPGHRKYQKALNQKLYIKSFKSKTLNQKL